MKALPLLGLLLGVALALAPAAVAADATSEQILSAINAERVANGLPGGITENPQWSQACALHDHYMAVNQSLTHFETSSAPAYTTAGDFAGQNSVLSEGASWLLGDPWLNAPIHLNQVMSPLLQTAGFAETENFDCFTTFVGYNPNPGASTDELFSFPGNGGSAPYAQTAFEAPHTPGEWVGLPSGTQTGPYLIVYWLGPIGDPNLNDDVAPPGWDPNTPYVDPTPAQNPLALLTAATVTGPDGAVAVDVLNTATHNGDGYYLAPDSGFVLPVHPLRPDSKYTVTATFSNDPSDPNYSGTPRSWTGSFAFHTTSQTLTLLGPAGRPTSGGGQTGGGQPQGFPAASSLRASSPVSLRSLRGGQLPVSLRVASAPARAQAVLSVGRRVLGASPVIDVRHAGPVMIRLTLDLAKLRKLLVRGRLGTVLRVLVVPNSPAAQAVALTRSLAVRR